MKTNQGDPVKDRKGYVHFGAGQLKTEEYEKWQTEQVSVKTVDIEKKAKVEFKKELEKTKKETITEEALISGFEANLKLKSVAEKFGVSTYTVNYWCSKFFKKSYKNAKQAHLDRKRAVSHFYPETVEMPLEFEDRLLGTTFKDPRDITDDEGAFVDLGVAAIEEILKQLKGKPLCPILANEVSGMDWRGYPIEPDQLFHDAITDLPYYYYNPVKRLRRAAASW